MKKKSLKVLSTVLAASMLFGLAGCGNKENVTDPTPTPVGKQEEEANDPESTQEGKADATPTGAAAATETPSEDKKKEIVTIRFGTHNEPELNPHWKNEITGEYAMTAANREAMLAAEEAILNELGVKFEYLQYSGDVREVLLQSVMANDPVCDIAWMWGGSEGTVLGQNILQKLDDYVAPFTEDPEMSWMLYDQCFGHYYFLGAYLRNTPRWPLVYNINYVEQVDSLKDENGNTIYPNDLYLSGDWTWSTFRDYLEKIEAYYANSTAPVRPDRRIDTYQTDYRYAALSAAHANGAGVFTSNGLVANSTETKEAVAFIEELLNSKLMTFVTWSDEAREPGHTWSGGNFQMGETVFTDIPDWFISGAASQAAERNESIGIVPWPRPDDMAMDDERYEQVLMASDSIGILKGVSPEKTELALKALALFYKTYYCKVAGVNSIDEYRSEYAVQNAANSGFDVFHEKVGASMQATYAETVSKLKPNDLSDVFGIYWTWGLMVVRSIYGMDDYTSYDISIESKLDLLENKISDIAAALQGDALRDNIAPSVNLVSNDIIAFPAGTAFGSISWGDYITVRDNVDGVLDTSGMEVTWEKGEVDFNVPGTYNDAFTAKFSDVSGNSASRKISFVIYDPENTVPPTVVAAEKGTASVVAVDANVNDIPWMGEYIQSAADADGLDLSRRVKADLSTIDSSTPGTYTVTLTVTDYAGNETSVDVEVVVE